MINHYNFKLGKFESLTNEASIKKSHFELMAEHKAFGWTDRWLRISFDKEELLTKEALDMLKSLKYTKQKGTGFHYACSNWYVPENNDE